MSREQNNGTRNGKETEMKTYYRIEDRYPAWARWRIVTPNLHGESFPFDSSGLLFDNLASAQEALEGMQRANGGEFRLLEVYGPK